MSPGQILFCKFYNKSKSTPDQVPTKHKDYCSVLAFINCAEVAFPCSETEELQNGGLVEKSYKAEMVQKSETKTKTKTKDENTTLLVNSLLFFMKDRFKSFALDSTQLALLHYCNEQAIAEAKLLLLNKVASGKKLIKRQGEEKARETLNDVFAMIEEMDADPNNSTRLVNETSDFPSLE